VTVRSARLALVSVPIGVVTTIYTVPAGRTTILKDVRLNSASGPASRAVVLGNSGAVNVALVDISMVADQTHQVQGFMVLEPGDKVNAFCTDHPVTMWLSGSELDGVAP
jgi:hypothetical protein